MVDSQKQGNKFPKEFVEKIKFYFPAQSTAIFKYLRKKEYSSFRLNHNASLGRETVLKFIKDSNIIIREVKWDKDAFIFKTDDLRKLQENIAYREKAIYIQNLSSMLAPLLLELKEGEKVLDLCSAPGSKTTQIASILRNKVELIAIEKVKKRFFRLLNNLAEQNVNCVKAYLNNGVNIKYYYKDYFDKVLLDAPCSAEGVFDIDNKKSFAYWSARKVKEMQRKQVKLLKSAWSVLRAGGILLYSTCTFSPKENEIVINKFLKKTPDAILMEINLPFNNFCDGFVNLGGNENKELYKTKHILPTNTMEGFFVAKMVKDSRGQTSLNLEV